MKKKLLLLLIVLNLILLIISLYSLSDTVIAEEEVVGTCFDGSRFVIEYSGDILEDKHKVITDIDTDIQYIWVTIDDNSNIIGEVYNP